MFEVEDQVLTYDHIQGKWVKVKIVGVRKNVPCCGTHDHALVYDVLFHTGKISKGHLPHAIKEVV